MDLDHTDREGPPAIGAVAVPAPPVQIESMTNLCSLSHGPVSLNKAIEGACAVAEDNHKIMYLFSSDEGADRAFSSLHPDRTMIKNGKTKRNGGYYNFLGCSGTTAPATVHGLVRVNLIAR